MVLSASWVFAQAPASSRVIGTVASVSGNSVSVKTDAGAIVSVATVPIAAQVMFIPTFFYELCKVQKQNADDPNGCPQWREAVEGKLQSVAGDYMYFVRWRDGVVRRGKRSFDMGDDGRTITLRKP